MAVSTKILTWGIKWLSKSCYFLKVKPPKQAPQVIIRRKNVLANNCETSVRVGNMDKLLAGSASAGVSHSVTIASVNTSHRWRGAASIKHHTTGNSGFGPLGETLETVSKHNKISKNEHWLRAHF